MFQPPDTRRRDFVQSLIDKRDAELVWRYEKDEVVWNLLRIPEEQFGNLFVVQRIVDFMH